MELFPSLGARTWKVMARMTLQMGAFKAEFERITVVIEYHDLVRSLSSVIRIQTVSEATDVKIFEKRVDLTRFYSFLRDWISMRLSMQPAARRTARPRLMGFVNSGEVIA